jgi:hypothetical protein
VTGVTGGGESPLASVGNLAGELDSPARWEVASIPDRAVAVASERRRAILAVRAEDS